MDHPTVEKRTISVISLKMFVMMATVGNQCLVPGRQKSLGIAETCFETRLDRNFYCQCQWLWNDLMIVAIYIWHLYLKENPQN
jgi:hypothetical protein